MKLFRRARHATSIVALLFAFGCALSSNAQKREPNDKGNEAGNLKRDTATAASTPNQTASGNDQDHAESRWDKFLDRLIDPVTWFTGGLLWLAVRQYRAMRKQADYMRDGLDATKKAADAAEASATIALAQKRIGDRQLEHTDAQIEIARTTADAAKQSAATATMALTHAERAYINAQDWEAEISGGFPVALKLAIKNSGRTPGSLISTSWYASYSARPPARPTTDQLHRIQGLNSFVTPGDVIEVDLEVSPKVDLAILNALKDETTYLWVYMEVSYTDVFQKDRLTHWTRICRRLHRPTMKLESAPEANYDYAD